MRMWCEVCQDHGDHFTKTHPIDGVATHRRSFESTPFIEALVGDVQATLSRNRSRKVSFNEALLWILEDFAWCGTDKPAFGHFSPVMSGHVRDVLKAARGEK